MYKDANGNYVEDGDKYYILMDLYNAWHKRTRFLSVGNTNVEEWDKLLEYCKENKAEAGHFYLDLIECYTQEYKDGTRADNFVGFFPNIISEIFKDEIPYFTGCVSGRVMQATYKTWLEECYFGDKDDFSWIDKIKILTT